MDYFLLLLLITVRYLSAMGELEKGPTELKDFEVHRRNSNESPSTPRALRDKIINQ